MRPFALGAIPCQSLPDPRLSFTINPQYWKTIMGYGKQNNSSVGYVLPWWLCEDYRIIIFVQSSGGIYTTHSLMRMAASVSSLVFLLSMLGPALSPMICCSSEPFYNGRWLHFIHTYTGQPCHRHPANASDEHIYKLSRKNINIYRE